MRDGNDSQTETVKSPMLFPARSRIKKTKHQKAVSQGPVDTVSVEPVHTQFRRNKVMIGTIQKRILGLTLATIAVAGFWFAKPIAAVPGGFSGTITMDPGPTVQLCLGDSVTFTADYSTNKDVTRMEWSVDGFGQGVQTIPDGALRQHGSDSFEFTPDSPGTYTISFRIWHHAQSSRDIQEDVNVTVTSCTFVDGNQECPAAPAVAGAYLRNVMGMHPSDPLYSEIIEEVAHVMHVEFGFDPCAPGYADDVKDFIDTHWMLN